MATINGYTITVLGSDTFHHANQSPYISPNWSLFDSFDNDLFAILNNEAVAETASILAGLGGGDYWVGSAGWSVNQFAQVQIDGLAADEYSEIDLWLRASTDANFGYDFAVLYNPNSDLGPGPGLYFIGGVSVNGDDTTLSPPSPNPSGYWGPYTFIPGATFCVGIYNTFYFVMYNGVVLWSGTDSTLLASGSVALEIFANALQTDAQVSNFLAGTIAPTFQVSVLPGYIVENSQKQITISGQLKISGNFYPVGGFSLDPVLLALPEATTNSGVKFTTIYSGSGSGYIYQRIPSTGNLMVLETPQNGSLVTAAPLTQISASTNIQGIKNDVIIFEAQFLRNA